MEKKMEATTLCVVLASVAKASVMILAFLARIKRVGWRRIGMNGRVQSLKSPKQAANRHYTQHVL